MRGWRWRGADVDGFAGAGCFAGRVSQHGVAILQEALRSRGWNVQPAASLDAATAPLVVVAGASTGNGPAAQLLRETGGTLPTVPEAITIKKTQCTVSRR